MLCLFGSSCKGVLPTTHHTIACRRCRLARPRPTASTTASKVASYGSSPRVGVRGKGRGWRGRRASATVRTHDTFSKIEWHSPKSRERLVLVPVQAAGHGHVGVAKK